MWSRPPRCWRQTRGVSLDEIARQTTENFFRLFSKVPRALADAGMTLSFTILGCGSSMGVPRVALGWGDCDPNNPKNRRRRCSLAGRARAGRGQATRVLVDCSPDLREQLLDAEVDWLDGVLITHEHADHTHGIDDLRPLFVQEPAPGRRLHGRADLARHARALRLLLHDAAGQRISADR